MASSINPRLFPPRDSLANLLDVFDYIASRGNALASTRKIEVEELIRALGSLDTDSGDAESTLGPQAMVLDNLPGLDDLSFSEWNGVTGLSASQIVDLAEDLSVGLFEDLWTVS